MRLNGVLERMNECRERRKLRMCGDCEDAENCEIVRQFLDFLRAKHKKRKGNKKCEHPYREKEEDMEKGSEAQKNVKK
jgi:hypothetical protein